MILHAFFIFASSWNFDQSSRIGPMQLENSPMENAPLSSSELGLGLFVRRLLIAYRL